MATELIHEKHYVSSPVPAVFTDQTQFQYPYVQPGDEGAGEGFWSAFATNSFMVVGSMVISALMFTTVLAINEFILSFMEKNFEVHEKLQILFLYSLFMVALTAVVTVVLAELMRRVRVREEAKRRRQTMETLRELEQAELLGQTVMEHRLRDSVLLGIIDQEAHSQIQDNLNGLLFDASAQNFISKI